MNPRSATCKRRRFSPWDQVDQPAKRPKSDAQTLTSPPPPPRLRPVEQMILHYDCTMNNPPPSNNQQNNRDSPPSPPALSSQAWNLASSLAAFVADGMKTVTKHQYQQRLEICDACNRRQGNPCMECGCRISLKAQGRAFRCPLNKWPKT